MIKSRNIGKKEHLRVIPVFYGTDEAEKARESKAIGCMATPYGLDLPCGMNMDEEKVRYVCDVFKGVLLK